MLIAPQMFTEERKSPLNACDVSPVIEIQYVKSVDYDKKSVVD